jgi:hypothetical protein
MLAPFVTYTLLRYSCLDSCAKIQPTCLQLQERRWRSLLIRKADCQQKSHIYAVSSSTQRYGSKKPSFLIRWQTPLHSADTAADALLDHPSKWNGRQTSHHTSWMLSDCLPTAIQQPSITTIIISQTPTPNQMVPRKLLYHVFILCFLVHAQWGFLLLHECITNFPA